MIVETIRRHAHAAPSGLAIAFYANASADEVRLSWAQLWQAMERLGTALSTQAKPADRVLLIFPQGIEFHLAHLACNYIGAVPVPVPLPTGAGGEERLRGVVADSDCALIITLEHYRDHLTAIGGDIPIATYEELEAGAPKEIAPPHASEPNDLAFIQYTSGSVSTPKGVLVTFGNLDANMKMMREGRHDDTRTFLCWVPHFHDMGLIGNFYLVMHNGGELHLTSADTFVRRPLSWLKLVSRTKATTTTVPHFALTLCSRLAHTLKPDEIDLSNLRLIVNSSEPVDWDGLLEFEQSFAPFGLAPGTVVPHYGLAECTVMVTYPTSDRPRFLQVDQEALTRGTVEPTQAGARSLKIVNCGRGQLDSEFAVVDPETRKRCASGECGEIWISGSHVAQGFWNRAEETATTFRQTIEGDVTGKLYVRSGDLGFEHDGDLFVTGRMKDVIIIRGQNYYARDIEILAEQTSSLVRAGRVVAIAMEHKGEETVGLLAEVAAKFDYRKDAQAFVSTFSKLLMERLGLSAQSIVLVRRNSLPRTTSGKIRRRDAAKMYRQGELSTLFEYQSSRYTSVGLDKAAFPGLENAEDLRRWLEALILDQAGVSNIAHNDDLFALGLDSLSMTNLLLEIEELTGKSLLEEQFYTTPTLNTLVALLVENGNTDDPVSADSAASPATPEKPVAKQGLKKTVARRLRDFGPILGPLKLSYRTGSRLLDRLTLSPSVRDRLSRPFLRDLETLIADQNIQDPDKIRREVARSFAWVGWREGSLSDPDIFSEFVSVKGLEHVQHARDNGQGVILCLVTTRFKGLYKFIPELREKPLGTIANLTPDRIEFYGMGPLAQKTGGKASYTVPSARVAQIHNAHRLLAQQGTVGIFMDAFDGPGGISLPFLGRIRPFRPGIAELALDTNSVVIPVEHWLHDEGRVTIEFKPPFTVTGETRDEKVLSLMIQQAASLEEIWRGNPGQMNDEAIRRQLNLPKA